MSIMLYNYTIILFRSFLKKDIRTLIFINQKKPCISLEWDTTKVQANEDIERKRERKTIAEFIVIDETLIKVVGNQCAWLCMGCYLSNQ
jgi:hypothetical protein